MNNKNLLIALFLLISVFKLSAQEEQELPTEKSNIQNYTPSKLLEVGKIDIKWFNNLYTETEEVDFNGVRKDKVRGNYFNTSVEVFTGITKTKWLNVGLIAELRSNSFAGSDALSVFEFRNEKGLSRAGLGHIAPSIKVAPFKKWNNVSFQSSFFIPTHDKELDTNGFLTEKAYIWQNRFYFDYTLPSGKFQVFSELGTRYIFGEATESYASDSFEVAPGVFFSYFPTSKFTVLTYAQHVQLLDAGDNAFSKDFSVLGLGAKYQLTKALNVETIYGRFVRGTNTGLGQSFNLGLRAIF